MIGLGLEVGVGEGVEAMGLSGFVCCGSARFVWVGVWLDLFGLGAMAMWVLVWWLLESVC